MMAVVNPEPPAPKPNPLPPHPSQVIPLLWSRVSQKSRTSSHLFRYHRPRRVLRVGPKLQVETVKSNTESVYGSWK
jgi:hypothetical protein